MRAGRSVESGLMKGGTVVHEGVIQWGGGHVKVWTGWVSIAIILIIEI